MDVDITQDVGRQVFKTKFDLDLPNGKVQQKGFSLASCSPHHQRLQLLSSTQEMTSEAQRPLEHKSRTENRAYNNTAPSHRGPTVASFIYALPA